MDAATSALREEIEELKTKLTEEKVANLELDLNNNDVSKKVIELERRLQRTEQLLAAEKLRLERTEDSLAAEKLKSQQLSNQIQSLQIDQVETIENYETIIAENQEQIQQLHFHILRQNAVIVQQQKPDPKLSNSAKQTPSSQPLPPKPPKEGQSKDMDSSNSSNGRRLSFSRPWHSVPDSSQNRTLSEPTSKSTNNGGDPQLSRSQAITAGNTWTSSRDDEFDKYSHDVLKFDDDQADDSDSELSDTMQLRHRLLEEQMKHENTKHKHRESIYQLEQMTTAGGVNDVAVINERLQEEVASLKEQLENERKKREHLDKERRNSLAALSQNMFKKLLDSEHQHYDDKSDLEGQCQQLKSVVRHLEMSKQVLLKETSTTIDQLRHHIKLLGRRLQKYENWD